MPVKLSLKSALVLAFVVLATVLVIGYSVLSARYYLSGMDTMIADSLVRAANETVPSAREQGLPVFDVYTVTRRWEDQHPALLKLVREAPPLDKKLYKVRRDRHETGPGRPFYFMGVMTPEGPRYVSFYIAPKRVSRLTAISPISSLILLLSVGLASTGAVVAVVWLLLRRISRPIESLAQWAAEQDGTGTDKVVPDFGFSDLNHFARLLQAGLESARHAIEREQTFLRQASHELRTPIAVVRNNVQLLRKLDAVGDISLYARQQEAIDRIERASLTMKQLVETLLWLNRGGSERLALNAVRIDQLVEELVDDIRYVYDQRGVGLTISTEAHSEEIPEAVVRIVLGNLIRNAFQYTLQGEVNILQHGATVSISNRLDESGEGEQDLGFGLGLQLTERLIDKMNWAYQVQVRADGRDAVITLQSCC